MGAEFSKKYPKIAGRLLLEPDKCEDPHTERLIEAFAFISSRIHKKIDDDFPELTESLFNIIYPHYINPIPSTTIVQFSPLKQKISEVGYTIDNNSTLYSKPVNGTPCQFTTRQPVTLWPVEVVSAELQDPKDLIEGARQAIVLQLKTFNNIKLSDLAWDKLCFYLNGPTQHIYHLYELLFNNVCHIKCESTNPQGTAETISLAPDNIKPVGFTPEEGLLPYSPQSFAGYLLLFEYFCFPERFLFFELSGLDKIKHTAFNDTVDIWLYLNTKAAQNFVINKETFCLNATPAINLFKRIAEPIRVEQQKSEYRVIPDIRRQETIEVLSIDRVTASSSTATSKENFEIKPFYSIRHHLHEDVSQDRNVFWHSHRRASGKKEDEGTDVFISFANQELNWTDPGEDIITAHTTCTNRDLPARLPFGDPTGDFNMETATPVSQINSLLKPTATRRPSLGGGLQWRLISHLSLNYMSLVQGGGEALKEILKLYDFDDSPASRQQINGIISVQSERVTKRVGRSFCRGIQVTIEFDEDKYVGAGLYLFASVLERFLAQYVSINSFSQLVAKTTQKQEVLKQWQPRNGSQVLL